MNDRAVRLFPLLLLALPFGCRDPVRSAAASPQPAERKGTAAASSEVRLPSFSPLVDQVRSAVVNVEVKSRVDLSRLPEGHPDLGQNQEPPGPGDDFFDRFFGGQGPRRRREFLRQGQGSGFIISPAGLALTNNHVVANATAISVKLEDGRRFDAEVAGRDPLTDIAVLRLKEASGLPTVKLGDSEAMAVGDWTVAIGNPFGLASSVSSGIISARARQIGAGPYDDFLQTDAAINPGNSGGPLFNLQGEVIGMNTAIAGLGTGIGFAVPSNMIRTLLPRLEKGQPIIRGWLGVAIQDLTPALASALGVPEGKGAVVAEVTSGAPAAKGGIKPNDVIVAVDDKPITSASELSAEVAKKSPGTRVNLTVFRGTQKQNVRVEVGTRPDIEGVGPQPEPSAQPEGQQRLGLVLQDLSRDAARGLGVPGGAVISDVRPGSPADEAELQPDWIIVEAGGKPVKKAEDLRRLLNAAKPGTSVLLRVQTDQGRILRALTIPKPPKG